MDIADDKVAAGQRVEGESSGRHRARASNCPTTAWAAEVDTSWVAPETADTEDHLATVADTAAEIGYLARVRTQAGGPDTVGTVAALWRNQDAGAVAEPAAASSSCSSPCHQRLQHLAAVAQIQLPLRPRSHLFHTPAKKLIPT